MNSNTYEVDHEAKQITTCAWCYPGNAALVAFPELAPVASYGISHGCCQDCLKKQKALLAAKRAENLRARIALVKTTLVESGVVS